MIDFHSLFDDFFADDEVSLTELVNFAGTSVGRMASVNPGGVLTPRINAMQGALSSLETNTTDAGVKLALQKSATANKKNFRKELVGNMAKVQAKVVGQYGKNGAQVLEIFPKGLAPFAVSAPEEPLENELGVVLAGVTAHQADLGAGVVTSVGSYLSSWLVLFNASKGAKTAKKSSNLSGGDLRKALQVECAKTALFVAFTFLEQHEKCDFYLPRELLLNPQAHPPGTASLTAAGGIGQATLNGTASNADEMKYFYRLAGDTDWNDAGSGAPGVNVVRTGLSPGSYEFMSQGTNDQGDGAESDVAAAEVT